MPAYDFLGEIETDLKAMIEATTLVSNGGKLKVIGIAPPIRSPEDLGEIAERFTSRAPAGWLGLPDINASKAQGPRVTNVDLAYQFGALFTDARGMEDRWAAARQTISDLLQALDLRKITLSGATSNPVQFTEVSNASFYDTQELMAFTLTIGLRIKALALNTPE